MPRWQESKPVDRSIGGPSIGGRIPSPEEEPEGFMRFLSGVKKHTIPTLEDIKNLGGVLGGLFESGTPEMGPAPPADNPLAELLKGMIGQQVEQFKQAPQEDTDLMKALRIAGGAVPVVGPPAADAIARLSEGDVAGGAGELAGQALPFARPFKKLAQARGVAKKAKAQSTLDSLLSPKKGQAQRTIEAGAEDISKGLGVGGLGRLHERAIKLADEANTALNRAYDKAEAAGKTVNLSPAAASVRATAKEIDLPKKALASKKVEVDFRKMRADEQRAFMDASPDERLKFIEDVQRQATEKVQHYTTLDQEYLDAVKLQAKKIEQMSIDWEGKVPVKQARIVHQQAGGAAGRKGAWSKSKTEDASAMAEAQKQAQQAVSEIIKEEVPSIRDANLQSTQWATVRDALYDAIEAERRSPKVPAVQIMAVRAGIFGAIGGVLGALGGPEGSALGAMVGAGGYGAFQIGRDMLTSPLWRSASARAKYAMADALGSGLLAKTTIAGRSTIPTLREEEK